MLGHWSDLGKWTSFRLHQSGGLAMGISAFFIFN